MRRPVGITPGLGVALALVLSVAGQPACAAEDKPVQRLIVALYDGREEPVKERTRVHLLATMPLNHLGLVVRLFDIRKGLPDATVMSRARGVLTWFSGGSVKKPLPYLQWANAQLAAGRRFVILGDPGVKDIDTATPVVRKLFKLMMARIGVRWTWRWTALTYDSKVVHLDRALYEFERKLSPVLPGYASVTGAGDGVKSHLTLEDKRVRRRSDVVVTGPNGGYVAAGYAVAIGQRNGVQRRAWLLNPFAFFRRAFGTEDLPKPDTTTLSGRRIFYSHVDGDAWHNRTRIERFRNTPTDSATVHYKWIIKGFPSLPVTVAPVVGDLMSGWYGDKAARDLARRMFAEPNVEMASHTHSHPFSWAFFRKNVPAAEIPYLSRYPKRPNRKLSESIWKPSEVKAGARNPDGAVNDRTFRLSRYYSRPRAYAVKRFDLDSEIAGSIAYLNKELAPPGKKVRLMQWSGDTRPFPAAVRKAKEAGVRNMNGGDPRMDGRYRSYAWLSGVGRYVDGIWQIYSSASNENIYTKGWTQNFSAYRLVIDTFRNTETPIRIKPINVYYHFYSLERSNSARSLILSLRYALSRPIAPITASRFAAMGDGFFATRIVSVAKNRWRIEDRDGIETIRFDKAALKAVDFKNSTGVIGQRHFQGSLYVALDGTLKSPVVALRDFTETDTMPTAARAYLVESRWRVFRYRAVGNRWRFDAQGFGSGEFDWRVPRPGRYRIRHALIETAGTEPTGQKTATGEMIVTTADHRLRFTVKTNDARARRFKISFVEPLQ